MFRLAKYDVTVVGTMIGGYFTLHARLRLPEEGSERCSRNVANTRCHICIRIARVAAMFSTHNYLNNPVRCNLSLL